MTLAVIATASLDVQQIYNDAFEDISALDIDKVICSDDAAVQRCVFSCCNDLLIPVQVWPAEWENFNGPYKMVRGSDGTITTRKSKADPSLYSAGAIIITADKTGFHDVAKKGKKKTK